MPRFADGPEPVVGLVECLLDVVEFTVFGFLERHGDGFGLAFVAEVAQRPEFVADVVQHREDLFVGAQSGGVVLASGAYVGGPDRPPVGNGDDLDVAAPAGSRAPLRHRAR